MVYSGSEVRRLSLYLRNILKDHKCSTAVQRASNLSYRAKQNSFLNSRFDTYFLVMHFKMFYSSTAVQHLEVLRTKYCIRSTVYIGCLLLCPCLIEPEEKCSSEKGPIRRIDNAHHDHQHHLQYCLLHTLFLVVCQKRACCSVFTPHM